VSAQGPVLVSGGTGFVGRRLVHALQSAGRQVRVLSRKPALIAGAEVRHVDFDDAAALQAAAAGCGAVCHLAARAHVLGVAAPDAEQLFEEANVALTVRLAEAAFGAGLKRFVFVSSIGVVGNSSEPGVPLTEHTPCRPTSAYGRSKLKAEQRLREIASRHRGELVILRPPLVHGPGAPGNLARLTRWVAKGVPLPFAGLHNQRSLVHVDNLAQALLVCIEHPRAAGGTFHLRDAHDYSTPEILQAAGRSCGRPARLFRLPAPLLAALMQLAGQRDAHQQLTGWLQVDDRHIRTTLGYAPAPRPFETA
jgi:nucleoside-diphosphate-sugar epimerase